ncbi:PTS system protein [Mycoplasmopsis californica]|uniref:Fructose-specific PTS transporter subunit EIIC n=1 Tax=Mycoplasmopsis equigenitalium TaxID=114883 RepID=A0ABY5J1B8_9BACT|nr:fructose-specific PTS transporter subunit EIIC [Mycoplasmopsis equigenitalium]UUD37052.1 fructose-specific PTS transporter subunit EIIC [Mycoplasmopsis equigenitalium]VEU69648.1 PTS system protein [Mycoplasmopsis californica]
MNIKEFFRKDLVIVNKSFKNKDACLKYLAKHLVSKNYAKNEETVLDLALKREKEFSTGIGNAIAIPHIRDDVMNESVVTFVKTDALDWKSNDNEKVKFVFFITMSKKDGESSHLEAIQQLSTLFMNENFVKELELVDSYDSLIKLLEKNQKNTLVHSTEKTNTNGYDIVAVTACPTGIAHTYMAAERLTKAAKEMGLSIKVETQGTEGSKNVLTQYEISNAKGVILAVDKVVDLSRFAGLENVLELGTGTAIKKPEEQIKKILNKEGKKLPGQKASGSNETTEDLISFDGFGKRIYKGIMNGVSFMLPFVVFGGIMIALAFLIDIKNAGTANYGSVNEVARWFKNLGGLAFGIMVPILSAYIAYGLVGRFGLLPGFICGFISIGSFLMKLDPSTGQISWFDPAGGLGSGFFGGIIGAILSAVLIIVFVKYVFGWVPASLKGLKNILFIPLFATFAIALVFWVINIPLIYLNYGFNKLLGAIESKNYLVPLLGLVLGLMMTSDLGGPINKAAYLFSIATISSGNGTVAMAATMAAGMVPPLGIALATSIFRKHFSQEEIQSGYVNYVMGLSFISEGAIPFTVAKPRVMVPANLVGGAITGLLVGLFQITLAAPHGGVFVFALVKTSLFSSSGGQIGGGIALYIAAIIAGAIAQMFTIWGLLLLYKKLDAAKAKKTTNLV